MESDFIQGYPELYKTFVVQETPKTALTSEEKSFLIDRISDLVNQLNYYDCLEDDQYIKGRIRELRSSLQVKSECLESTIEENEVLEEIN